MTRRARHGLTLLEVILAISLIVLLSGAVFAFYLDALDTRDRIDAETARLRDRRAAFNRLADELGAAASFPFLRMAMTGQAQQVRFITARMPSEAVWVPPRTGMDAPPREFDLALVGYRLRYLLDEQGMQIADEYGTPIVEGLERSEQRLLTAPDPEAGETFRDVQQIETTLVSARIRFVRFRYWTGDAWVGE